MYHQGTTKLTGNQRYRSQQVKECSELINLRTNPAIDFSKTVRVKSQNLEHQAQSPKC